MMKKKLFFLLVFSCLVTATACAGQETPPETQKSDIPDTQEAESLGAEDVELSGNQVQSRRKKARQGMWKTMKVYPTVCTLLPRMHG